MFGVRIGRQAAVVATMLPFAEPVAGVAQAACSSMFYAGPGVK